MVNALRQLRFPRRNAAAITVAALLVVNGCKDTEAPDDNTEAPDDEPGSTLVPVPATEEQLTAFRNSLMRYSLSQSSTPRDIQEMVQGPDVVLIGVLGPSAPGRKAPAGSSTGFNAYANLELRDFTVVRGTLPEPSDKAYLEIGWPSNVVVDELVDATPVGSRVIVLADLVEGALAQAQQLEMWQGIDAVGSVRSNLLDAPPYGLLVEGLDGRTHAPLWGDGPLLLSGADELATFDDAVAAVRAAARPWS